MDNILKKIFNPKKYKIYNFLFMMFAILIFEFGFCNHTFSENILKGEITNFHFSICRLVIYMISILAIVLINKKANFQEITETFNKKSKKISLLIYILIVIFVLLYIGIKAIIHETTTILLPQLSMLLLLLLSGFVFTIYISKNYTINIITISIVVMIFSFTCNTYHVIDEKKHFMEAYNISYGNLDFNNPVVDKQFMQEIPRGTHYISMVELFKVPYNYERGVVPENDKIDSTPTANNPILYIPSALGIFIGRILHGSLADVFLLGRLFNLIAYTILSIITLKVLPYKKNLFWVVFTIPMLICTAGTYSPDGLGFGVISLFIAYCLKIYNMHEKNEKVSMKHYILLIILYSLTLTFKSASYFAIGLIVFILPIKKILKENKKVIPILLLVAIICATIFFLLQPKITISGGDPRGGNSGVEGQIQNIKENPTILLKVVYNHLTGTVFNFSFLRDMHFLMFFSNKNSWMFICLFIYYIYVAIKDDSKNFKIKDKIIFIITFLLIFGITSAVLYLSFTPIGSEVLTGYTSRYLFQIILLILMCVSNKNIKNVADKENEMIKVSFMSNLILVISLIGTIFIP